MGPYEIALGHGSDGRVATFAFQHGEWNNLGVATPQTSMVAANLIYDAGTRTMLLFVDYTGSIAPVKVYSLSTTSWKLASTAGGPTQSVDYPPALVYDSSDGYVLYYGGSPTGCDCGSTQTWSYQSGTWHQIAPPKFPPRVQFPVLAYDPALGKVLLSNNGANGASNDFEFWTFHAGIWTRILPPEKPKLSGALGYDPVLHAIVETGVTSFDVGPYIYLWPNGGAFENISAETLNSNTECLSVTLTAISYDPAAGGMVCTGQNNGLWLFT
jgi:hypothetical protein